jgi:glutaredoxin
MSKKYKGKICVYCAEAEPTSTDHVFARKFFLEGDRMGLPQVPSCDPCNRAKATLEHYLASLLPFGARHSGTRDNLELVPGRLAKNKKLHREIAAGWRQVWTKEGGIYLHTATVATDPSRIEELFGLIVRGEKDAIVGCLCSPDPNMALLTEGSLIPPWSP